MLKKHRNVFAYSFDCLKRYRMRTAAIIIAFLVATTMISAVLFAKDGLEREAAFSVSVSPDLTVQYLKAGRVAPIPLPMRRTCLVSKASTGFCSEHGDTSA
jgi:hypothetical protein